MMRWWPKLGQRWGLHSWRLRARVSAAPQASSSSVKSGDYSSPTAYDDVWTCMSAGPMQAQSHCTSNLTFFLQSSCIPILGEGGSLTLFQRFLADVATIHYRTSQLTPQAQKKLTPQADREPGQYWSGHDWYSKLIRFEHEHRLLKFWTKFCVLHYGDLLAFKKQETWIDCSPNKN